jgi:N-acetylmuramoyl-L-alanine amidase
MKKRMRHSTIILSLLVFLLIVVGIYINESQAAKSVLYWGSNNNDVGILQMKLRQWGYYEGAVDYVYGPETAEAVKEFQGKNGLRIDGIVGRQTWGALGYEMRENIPTQRKAEAATASKVSRGDEAQLIARLIHAEARGEPYEGQVSVGAVLLNRVEDPAFPNSVSGVIYQPLAFESVANGQFNRAPTGENLKAARSALNGWDPVYGATFFWNPSKPVNEWIWSRDIVRTIGSHVFAH